MARAAEWRGKGGRRSRGAGMMENEELAVGIRREMSHVRGPELRRSRRAPEGFEKRIGKRGSQFRDQLIAAPLKPVEEYRPAPAAPQFRDQLIAAPLKPAINPRRRTVNRNSAIN